MSLFKNERIASVLVTTIVLAVLLGSTLGKFGLLILAGVVIPMTIILTLLTLSENKTKSINLVVLDSLKTELKEKMKTEYIEEFDKGVALDVLKRSSNIKMLDFKIDGDIYMTVWNIDMKGEYQLIEMFQTGKKLEPLLINGKSQ
jgi:hypothetical protein